MGLPIGGFLMTEPRAGNDPLRIWSLVGAVRGRARTGALLPQLISFGVMGAAAGLADYLVMIGAKEGFGVEAVVASLLGYAVGTCVSYILNRLNTFGSERAHSETTWRFIVVNVIGFGLTAALMWLLVRTLGIGYIGARLVTTALVFVLNFMSHRLWTFASGPHHAS